MGDKTGIEWTDATWNPVTGCTKVSPGCANCYIERSPPFRMGGRKFEYQSKEAGVTTGVTLYPERLEKPLRWQLPRKIFVCSLADLFHEAVPDEFIAKVFAIMAATPQHTYQVLTKRPERMCRFIRGNAPNWTKADIDWLRNWASLRLRRMPSEAWPLPNVWLGVSAENQHWADRRIPILAQIPAEVRFVSAEPMLGPLDLREWLPTGLSGGTTHENPDGVERYDLDGSLVNALDWVIVGGESGPRARPMHPDWVRSLRDQCCAAEVPFFFKQWGQWMPASWDLYDPTPRTEPDPNPLFFNTGKRAAGALLDGREWREWPEVVA